MVTLKFLLIFLISFFTNFFIIKFKPKFALDLSKGIQKFHKEETPRVGGLGVFIAFNFFCIFEYITNKNINFIYLLISSFPIFIGGILEDITKKVSPKKRLIFASISALLSIALFRVYIYKSDIILIDDLVKFLPFAVIFTIFAITGVSNAYNIIDGFNGLASSIAILVFLSFAYIGYIKNDEFIFSISLAMIVAILGFFIWNFPFGKIFLGDGGAYFIGFLIGILSVYILFKYKDISPWYPLLLSIYPVFETIFSIYRRKYIKRLSPTQPDSYHLHSLIYKRLIPKLYKKSKENKTLKNSLVTPVILIFYLPFIVLANIYWNNVIVLVILTSLFILAYLVFYIAIIKFKLNFLDKI